MNLVGHNDYAGMYYLEWSDGSLSDDFYNFTRAIYYKKNIQARLKLDRPADAIRSSYRGLN